MDTQAVFHNPLCLTSEQQQNLPAILEDFFQNFRLQEVQEILWQWLVVALSSDKTNYSTGQERSNLIFFYEKLLELSEAAWLLAQKENSE